MLGRWPSLTAGRPDRVQGDTVVVMGEGRVLESGPPLELRDRPDSRFGELWAAASAAQNH